MQNEQANALMAGLIILTFGFLEKNKYLLATCSIVFSVFVKLFGIVGFALMIFYPKKWKLILYSMIWTVLFLLIPIFFIDLEQYRYLLSSYWKLLSYDHSNFYGFSVMGWLNSWFGLVINNFLILIIGMLIFLFPLYKIKEYKYYVFRLLLLSSVLIWVVIFNHKAESPTFIIAMAGVSIWFVVSEKSTINIVLFIGAFLLTSLSPTDIFPGYLRDKFVIPYMLKAFPCILIWMKIVYDMVIFGKDERERNLYLESKI
jgi:hypothetical protein